MVTHYFTGGGHATAFINEAIDSLGNPLPYNIPNDEFNVPMVPVTLAAYNAAVAARDAFMEILGARSGSQLMFSPSKYRTSAVPLEGGFIAGSWPIAIFIPNFTVLGITQVQFKLDGVNVNLEGAAPWDYGTTDGGGNATRVAIPVGLHLVQAVVSATTGNFTVSANIEVE